VVDNFILTSALSRIFVGFLPFSVDGTARAVGCLQLDFPTIAVRVAVSLSFFAPLLYPAGRYTPFFLVRRAHPDISFHCFHPIVSASSYPVPSESATPSNVNTQVVLYRFKTIRIYPFFSASVAFFPNLLILL
jgi:hypothetical protein